MSSTRALKTRIRSVKNTKQITKAMQLVAASKMRRAQEADKASAPYTRAASELLTYLASQGSTDEHPLFERRHVRTRLFIVIASDKGLAGAYNTNVFKRYVQALKADDAEGIGNKTIAIGRKAAQFVTRLKDTELVGVYEELTDRPSGHELRSILNTAKDMFTRGEVDAVDLIFTEFVSSMTQDATVRRLLPAGFAVTDVSESIRDAKYEPSIPVVLDSVVFRLLGAQMFQALLDAKASEHSMRMVAMKNATDNASDLIDDLTLEMNKVRQGAITQELAEISGGVEAMKD
ncbi:ATP synthase F1 subunit gamma [Candidatus Saccharibacteria bacterium 32-50-13]|nr:MAG: ATP synthase F1 subunit gamma [Candidatus Saccharibacteria bacterium 32-50-13]